MPARCARYRTASGNDIFWCSSTNLTTSPPAPQPKHLKNALVAVDVERRRLLLVERTQSLPRRARLLERHDVADDRDDVGLGLQVVEEGLGKERHAVSLFSSTIVAPSPPSLSGAGVDGRDERMLAEERRAARRAAGRCRGRARCAAAVRRRAAPSSRNFSARAIASSTVDADDARARRDGRRTASMIPGCRISRAAFRASRRSVVLAVRACRRATPQVAAAARACACRGSRRRRACRRRRGRCLRRRTARRTRAGRSPAATSSARPSQASGATPSSDAPIAPSAARASARRSPTSPVESTGPRARACRSACPASASAFVLSSRHDGIDLGARFAQPLVQLVVEPLLEHRLALGEPRSRDRAARALAASAWRARPRVSLALAARATASSAIDAREVRGELRLAAGPSRARRRR